MDEETIRLIRLTLHVETVDKETGMVSVIVKGSRDTLPLTMFPDALQRHVAYGIAFSAQVNVLATEPEKKYLNIRMAAPATDHSIRRARPSRMLTR